MVLVCFFVLDGIDGSGVRVKFAVFVLFGAIRPGATTDEKQVVV
jgi:hypothetical protein